LTTKYVKYSLNFESVENVLSSNVVEFEFEFELRRISTPELKCVLGYDIALQQRLHFYRSTLQEDRQLKIMPFIPTIGSGGIAFSRRPLTPISPDA